MTEKITEDMMMIALTANNWEWNMHYLYNAKEMPDKKGLDHIQKIAYKTAKSKIRSGIRTLPNSGEILDEMVRMLKERGVYPVKVVVYDVNNKKVREYTCF